MPQPAALGFRAHSGWACAVAVSGSPASPIILERRRIETADPAIPGSKQPYHAAEPLSLEAAEALIRKCQNSSTQLATQALTALIAQLKQNGFTIAGAGILLSAARPLPGLPAILRSHPLLHTAEGEFFRESLIRASEHCLLPVTTIKEREVWNKAATLSGLTPDALQSQIDALGKTLGPPWRQDEKLASLAALIALR
jgi:hypothetical protein